MSEGGRKGLTQKRVVAGWGGGGNYSIIPIGLHLSETYYRNYGYAWDGGTVNPLYNSRAILPNG